METIEIINTLKVFNKWLRGKGKKYVNGEVDTEKVGDALKYAVTHLSRRVGRTDFITLVTMAEACVKMAKENKRYVTEGDKAAVKAGRKVVKFLLKQNG